jgi:transposase-like protein
MHSELTEQRIHCPYCGEAMVILLDTSAGDQSYVEDCQVCCRPMQVSFGCDGDELDYVQVNGDA